MDISTNPTDDWNELLGSTSETNDQFQEFRQEKDISLNEIIEDKKEENPLNDTFNNLDETKEGLKEGEENLAPAELDKNTASYLNKLFEEGILAPFEGEEIKTYDDFRDLLQENIKSQLELVSNSVLESELNNLPPQFQSVMKYGMNGGTDVQTLLESWRDAERIITLDPNSPEGKKEIVAEYLSKVGYGTEEMIANDIKAWEDLGTLDSKVEAYKPILEEMQMQKILMIEQQAEQERFQQQQFESNFLSAVEDVLTQDRQTIGLEIPVDLKQALYAQSLSQYESPFTGRKMDALEAIIEESKYGENANPAFYTELMFHAAYPEQYKAMLLSQVKAEIAQTTERKLRSQVQADQGKQNHVSINKNISIKPIKF